MTAVREVSAERATEKPIETHVTISGPSITAEELSILKEELAASRKALSRPNRIPKLVTSYIR
jgi:hypothetical protein